MKTARVLGFLFLQKYSLVILYECKNISGSSDSSFVSTLILQKYKYAISLIRRQLNFIYRYPQLIILPFSFCSPHN